ncbi:MAG: hypothetical protein PWQ97_1530 [Tepidanaerobacteraceae bacterium]|nr:hypothetical protein [Tepidanaerobacteraceae bacterium]
MIISASRRTDIPAFYIEWFMNRIEQGFFYSINPFNPKQIKAVSLRSDDVDAIVFWTKDAAPMLKYLDKLDDKGYKYYFQYTINDYPAIFEPHMKPVEERIETFIRLSQKIGKSRVVLRYDPIIVSNFTPLDYHIEKFGEIAERLSGFAERVVISFVDFYGKVSNRWKRLIDTGALKLMDITKPEHAWEINFLVSELIKIAGSAGMEIFSCAEKADFSRLGMKRGSCIDANLINRIFGLNIHARRDRNQRKECLCAESVDMGMYNTCPHLCTYCYANLKEQTVKKNVARHDATSPFLIGS